MKALSVKQRWANVPVSVWLLAAMWLVMALAGCGKSSNVTPSSEIAPGSAKPTSARGDFLATKQVFDLPRGVGEAATALVARALDDKTSVAAVREILTRAGVRIINGDGVALNLPATPSKAGMAIYDFQIPMLADSLREGGTVRLASLAELAPDLVGAELPEATLAAALQSWMESAPQEPTNPEAFDAALLRELANARPGGLAAGRIHLLSFLVLAADLYGTKAVLRRPETKAAAFGQVMGLGVAHAAASCPPESYDPWDGSGGKTGMTLTDWLLDIFGDGSKAQEAWRGAKNANKVKDVYDLLNSTAARAALVAGLKVEVKNDAGGKKLHDRHSSGGSDMNPVTFSATVRFETPWPGATVQCGPLKDYTIPNNSTVGGIWVEWSLLGDHLETLDKQSSEKLRRGGGGGSATGDDGKVELKAETVPEKFCPNDRGHSVDMAKCGKGELKTTSNGAEARLDLTRTPPIKIKDLLMGPDPKWAAGKAILKVLTDVATDIASSMRAAKSMVTVEWHQSGKYRFKGAEKIGPFDCVIQGESEAGLYGRWKVTSTCTMNIGGVKQVMSKNTEVRTSDEPGNQGELKTEGTIVSTIKRDGLQEEVKGSITEKGTAKIGGTEENPTITLTTTEFKMTMSGGGVNDGEAFTHDADVFGSGGRLGSKQVLRAPGGGGGANHSDAYSAQPKTYQVELAK